MLKYFLLLGILICALVALGAFAVIIQQAITTGQTEPVYWTILIACIMLAFAFVVAEDKIEHHSL